MINSRLWLGLLIVSNVAISQVPSTLKSTMILCANCHGDNGISTIDIYPNLAGQKAAYLEQQLINFREKKRPSPIMEPLSKALTDEEIVAISNYYASLSGAVD